MVAHTEHDAQEVAKKISKSGIGSLDDRETQIMNSWKSQMGTTASMMKEAIKNPGKNTVK